MAVYIEMEGHTTLTGKQTTITSTQEDKFLQNRSVSRRTPPSEG